MDEFIIPTTYVGDGCGLSVCFAGLNQEKYEHLELSIDGSNFFQVSWDGTSFYSESHTFRNLAFGQGYKITGRITVNGVVLETDTIVPLMQAPAQSTTQLSAQTLDSQKYACGGKSTPLPRPLEVTD